MTRSILFVAVVVLAAAQAGANDWMEMEVWKYREVATGNIRYGSAFSVGVDGVTGTDKVWAKLGGLVNPINLPEEDLGGGVSEYSAGAEGWTLPQLNGILAGANRLTVNTAGGLCVYDFTISTIPDSLFAPLPVVTDPVNLAINVPQDQTFQWTWRGDARVSELWTEVSDLADVLWVEDYSGGGGLALSDLSWQPNLAQTGWAVFTAGYDVVAPMDGSSIVSALTFNAGASTGVDFGWDSAEAFASAEGRAAFEVVPEPATLALLGIGALAIIRRRR